MPATGYFRRNISSNSARPSIGPTAELYAFHVDREQRDRGVSRELFRKPKQRISLFEFESAILGVMESDARARRFYEIAGWIGDGGTKIEARPGGVALREVRYRFNLRRGREES